VKIFGYLALAVTLIVAAGAAYRAINDAGYNRAIVEMQTDSIKAQNEAIEKRMAEWIATQNEAEVVIQIEEKIVEKIRVVTKEVPKVVKEIITIKPECSDLGPEYAGLLNAAVRASNNTQDGSATVTSNVADSLP